MYGSHLLPGERRTPSRASVAQPAPPKRSVRSIRKQFEAPLDSPQQTCANLSPAPASAPVTPSKKQPARNDKHAPADSTRAELAAFLNASKQQRERMSRSSSSASPHRASTPPAPANVGSLIEKWSAAATSLPRERDRVPLQERDLQRVDHQPRFQNAISNQPPVDSVDTFGSASADVHRLIPKTDPGRLESYVAAAKPLAAAADAALTADQSVREILSKRVQHDVVQGVNVTPDPPPRTQHQLARAGDSAPALDKRPSPTSVLETDPQQQTQVVVEGVDSDWGAAELYINQLRDEAQKTAEQAVQLDENDEYVAACELYCGVVDLYYKLIPFLSEEEGAEVYEIIKMYTHRCGVIREAFGDDLEDDDEVEDEELAQPLAEDDSVAGKQVEDVCSSGPAFERGGVKQHSRAHDAHKVRAEELAPPSRPAPPPPVVSASRGGGADSSAVGGAAAADRRVGGRALPSSSSPKRHAAAEAHDQKEQQEQQYALQRTPYPDYSNEKPLAVPEAARGGGISGISATAQAHRNSLNRPVSRSAVRASSSSISRERVADMFQRMDVMKECLNNFTVKRKHLGMARALEMHITALNANTFGELKRLEPLSAELEHRWATELEVLLPMIQEIKVMRPGVGYKLREDIEKHLPALERCDRSVRKTMVSFAALLGHVEYVDRETSGDGGNGGRATRRWWVKVPVVKKGGLPSEVCRIVEEAEKEMRGVFKICHEINVDVMKMIPVPQSFVETLPKHARSLIPRELKEGLTTWGMFKVSDYLKDRNLWHKDSAKEITSSLEKVALIWEAKTSNQSFLSRTFDIRGERFHQAMTAFRRCQNAIRELRREWYVYCFCFCSIVFVLAGTD